jgi:hypothetical protein
MGEEDGLPGDAEHAAWRCRPGVLVQEAMLRLYGAGGPSSTKYLVNFYL